jgi:hypothetical protein
MKITLDFSSPREAAEFLGAVPQLHPPAGQAPSADCISLDLFWLTLRRLRDPGFRERISLRRNQEDKTCPDNTSDKTLTASEVASEALATQIMEAIRE